MTGRINQLFKYNLIAVLTILLLPGCISKTQPSRPYLILYAFEAEGKLLAAQMEVQRTDTLLGRAALTGRLSGKEIVLAESGVGMTNAAMTTQILIDRFNPKGVIFTGIAGAIDTSIRIGDIGICRRWHTHDYGYHGKDGFKVNGIHTYNGAADSIMSMSYFETDSLFFAKAGELTGEDLSFEKIGDREPKLFVGGAGVSGNCFIDSREKRIWLQAKFDALITDMESAAVGQVCTANDIPFIVFRSASDLAGGSGSETAGDELERFFKIAADNSSKVVMEFISDL
jgi:adenosylhomocysteine nucleosidase